VLSRLQVVCILLFGLLVFPVGGVLGQESGLRKNVVDRNTPIQIASDRMDAYSEKGMVVFGGNAVATQGDRKIRAETITLYYKQQTGTDDRQASADFQGSGELDRIEARGNVRITQGDRTVTGNEAVYLQDVQKIVISGNATLSEGKNVIQGEQVVVFLNENRGVVESTPGGRVDATIFPAGKREGKP